MTDEHATLTIATRLVTRGLSIFPVPRPGPGCDGKTPVVKWKRYQQTFATPQELAAWFATPQNIAVATGPLSGVVVVDVDDGAALDWARAHLPATPWRTLTAKGVHLWYRHPGVPVPNRVKLTTAGAPAASSTLALDIRGDGGYVLAPGSHHASGVKYRCAGDWRMPRTALPVFSPDWFPLDGEVTKSQRVSPRASDEIKRRRFIPTTSAPALARARAYLAATPRPEIGHGSDVATFVAACRLVRGFALASADAEALLWDWAGARPGWSRDWIAVKVQSALVHGKEPIGACL